MTASILVGRVTVTGRRRDFRRQGDFRAAMPQTTCIMYYGQTTSEGFVAGVRSKRRTSRELRRQLAGELEGRPAAPLLTAEPPKDESSNERSLT
jgi:hypothetical protein